MTSILNTSTATVPMQIEHGDYIVYPYEGKVANKKTKRIVGSISKSTGYVYVGNPHLAVHRLVYEAFHNVKLTTEQHINHINHVKHDNRIENLEVVSNQQNGQWIKKRSNSKDYKGVFWNLEKKKWKADLKYNAVNNFLGYFDNEIEAAKSYNDYATFLNNTKDCKYMLNDIPEENYSPTPRNIPEENKKAIVENKSCPKFVGVSYSAARNVYNVSIKFEGKSYNLGAFKDQIEAGKTYNMQALFFNKNKNSSYTLNDIPGYITVEKDIITEKEAKKQSNKTSKYFGVTFSNQNKKWRALLVYDKKQVHIGFFTDEIEAAKQYNKKAQELNDMINSNNDKRTLYKLNVVA